MSKINKSEFLKVIEIAQFVINDAHGAVGVQEMTGAVRCIQARGLELIDFLDANRNNFNVHAKKLINEAESTIDRSTTAIKKIKERISRWL